MDDLNENSVLKNLKEESPFEDAFREMSFEKKPGSSPKPALMLVNSDKTYTNCNEIILLFISFSCIFKKMFMSTTTMYYVGLVF